jgi:hypothetical protein
MQNRSTGRQVVGIMGAAQIDPFGNLNSTVIGDYFHPRVRLSGSGGACDVASFVGRTIIFMQHEKRKFVCRRTGGGDHQYGHLSVLTTPPDRMYLDACYPGVTPDQVLERMGFQTNVAPHPPASMGASWKVRTRGFFASNARTRFFCMPVPFPWMMRTSWMPFSWQALR